MVGRAASRRWVNYKDVDSMVTRGTIPRMDCWTMHRFACRERARAFRCLLVQWICPPKDRASLLRKLRKLHQPSTYSLTLTSQFPPSCGGKGMTLPPRSSNKTSIRGLIDAYYLCRPSLSLLQLQLRLRFRCLVSNWEEESLPSLAWTPPKSSESCLPDITWVRHARTCALQRLPSTEAVVGAEHGE